MDDTGTWHYGLVARYWEEVNAADPGELAYYRAAIERYGEPALDLGCGAGRLLVPLCAAGLDVDGADVSQDMLDRAMAAAGRAGIDLAGRLVRCSFSGLELARRHRTVICVDSFGIGGSRADDELALRGIHENLEPGGALVFSIDLATPAQIEGLADPARVYPSEWPVAGRRARLADGDELELVTRVAWFDRVTRVETMEIRARLWHGDTLKAEQEGRLLWSHYSLADLLAMLATAGFRDVNVEGCYTGRPATSTDETVVLVARRVS